MTFSYLTSCKATHFILYFSTSLTNSKAMPDLYKVLTLHVLQRKSSFWFPVLFPLSPFRSLVCKSWTFFFYKTGLLALRLTANLDGQATPTNERQNRATAMYLESKYIGRWELKFPYASARGLGFAKPITLKCSPEGYYDIKIKYTYIFHVFFII